MLSLEGLVLFERGNVEAARASFVRALSFEPEFIIALDNLDRLDHLDGQEARIEPRLRLLLSRRPRSDDLIVRLADHLSKTEGTRSAIELLEEKRVEFVESIFVARRLIAAYLSIGDIDRPLQILGELLITHSDSVITLNYVHQTFQGLGAHDRAVDVSRRLITLEPDVIEHRLMLAHSMIDAGRRKEARRTLLEAQELAPENIDIVRSLVAMDLEEGKVDDALTLADSVEAYDRVLAEGVRASILIKTGDLAAGLEALERAYAIRPASSIAVDLFFARRKTGDGERAIADLQRHLSDWSKDRTARHALAGVLIQSGRLEEAMAEYQSLVESDSVDPLALNNLAWLRSELGYSDGLDLAKRAYQIAPDGGQAADTYGWLLVKAKQVEEGIVVLRDAVGRSPTNMNTRYRLAYALNQAGQTSEAKLVLETILASSETFRDRPKAEALMARLRP